MKEKEPYVIGIDLGINNVGWSIINCKDKKADKMGVRLFTASSAAEDRRGFRAARRLKKRKDNREKDITKLFNENGINLNKIIDSNLLDKRLKGLKEKIELQDILNICCYFVTHRGYIPFGDEERELIKLDGLYPCEYYAKLLKEKGKYRALIEVVDNKDLNRELIDILNTQSKYYSVICDMIPKILEIFNRKRKFWEGPGSVNSLTLYGRFKTEEDVIEYKELKESGKEKYIYENLIGKCSVLPGRQATIISNYYYELFNLLNDFINTSITTCENVIDQSLIEEDKNTGYFKLNTKGLNKIIDYVINYEGTLSYSKVYKEVLGVTKDQLSGYRIDKSGKPEFSLFKTYRYINNLFKENNLNTNWIQDISEYNKLLTIMALTPGFVEFKNYLENNKYSFNEEELNAFKTIMAKLKKDGVLKYGTFSEELLLKATDDMINECLNYSSISKKHNYMKDMDKYFIDNYNTNKNLPLIDNKFVDEIVSSPQVKKSLRQTIKVINAIILEKGYYPETIVVESTKDMNGAERKKEIEREQRLEEDYRKKAVAELEKYFSDDKITNVNIEKTKLFLELDGRCPYCGNPIEGGLNAVINGKYEIEHILPISITGDNSYNNKTLAHSKCNNDKGNRTPYQYLGKDKFEDMEKRINNLKISDEKKKHFLETGDISKYTQRFFNRNLRDTAYGTKELINQIAIFNSYLEHLNMNTKINTLSTPGALTHNIRKEIDIEKNRDAGKYHHAVDATIVGMIAIDDKLGKTLLDMQNNKLFWKNDSKVKYFKDNIGDMTKHFNIENIVKSVKDIDSDEKIFISEQVQKDPNKSFANANIYKYIKKNGDYYRVEQLNNIYSPDLMNEKKLDDLFNPTDDKYKFMIQDNNPKMFEKLCNIYNSPAYRKGKENPFLNYCLELNNIEEKEFNPLIHGIKQENGPVITKLRYYCNCNDPLLLEKKNISKKENTYIGMDSVSQYCTKLYYDLDKQEFIFLPVYIISINLNTKEINEQDKTYKLYFNKYLKDKKYKFVCDLFNGNYIEFKNKNNEVQKGTISYFHKTNNKMVLKNGDYFTKSSISFSLYDVDTLGNKKIRLTYPDNNSNM